MGKDWLLDRLMTYRLGAWSESGYESLGVTVRAFTEAEKKRHGAGFVRFDHNRRTFEIELDEEKKGGCPVARYLIGLHESGHVVNGHVQRGLSTKRFAITEAEQEAEAWRFVSEVIRANYSTVGKTVAPAKRTGYVDFCLNDCVGAKDEPSRCTQPSMSRLLEEIRVGGNRGSAIAKNLADELIKAIQVNNNGWFSKAGKGLKDQEGNPVLPASKATKRGNKAVGVKVPKNPKGKLLPKFTEAIRRVHISEQIGGRVVKPTRRGKNGYHREEKIRMIDGVPHVLVWVYKDTGEPVRRTPMKRIKHNYA